MHDRPRRETPGTEQPPSAELAEFASDALLLATVGAAELEFEECGAGEPVLGASANPADLRHLVEATMAIGRLIEPREVAAAVMYLASPDARASTGACLVVDGDYRRP